MSRPIDKFYGEQDSRHGGELVWNKHFMFPIRLSSSEERNRIIDHTDLEQRLYLAGTAGARLFDLSKPDDHEYYLWIKDRAINGWFVIQHQEHHWDDNAKNMLVYLEWFQLYYQFVRDTDSFNPFMP